MIFQELPLRGAFVVELTPFQDNRGQFARYFCKQEFAAVGLNKEFVQMNHSWTSRRACVRGMHFQKPPHAEIKLIRCIKGRIFDVIVDVRENSPSFLKWCGVELSAANKKMIYVPEGFAHGFQALEDDIEMLYHHTESYTPGYEGGILHNDPVLGIEWPLEPVMLSDKDLSYPLIDQTNFKGI